MNCTARLVWADPSETTLNRDLDHSRLRQVNGGFASDTRLNWHTWLVDRVVTSLLESAVLVWDVSRSGVRH